MGDYPPLPGESLDSSQVKESLTDLDCGAGSGWVGRMVLLSRFRILKATGVLVKRSNLQKQCAARIPSPGLWKLPSCALVRRPLSFRK